MSKFDKVLNALRQEARKSGGEQALLIEDINLFQEQVDDLEEQLLEAWLKNDELKDTLAAMDMANHALELENKALIKKTKGKKKKAKGKFGYNKYIEGLQEQIASLQQSLECGMKHQEGLREELGEAQTANDLLVVEVDDQNDELQQMRMSATLDNRVINKLEKKLLKLKVKLEKKTNKKKKGKGYPETLRFTSVNPQGEKYEKGPCERPLFLF